MKPSDDLFKLIQSLDKHEKRYFKMFSTSNTGDKKYIALFDAIDAQKEYNEAALRKKFAKEQFVRQFAVAKNYLYNLILKALNAYHNDTHSHIIDLMRSTRILINKGLYDQARKTYNKAKTMAMEHEYFALLLELFPLEWKLNDFQLRDVVAFEQSVQQSLNEFSATLEKFENLSAYSLQISKKTFAYAQLYGAAISHEEQQRYQHLLEHPLLADESCALSFRAKVLFFTNRSSCWGGTQQFEKQYQDMKQLVVLCEQHVGIISVENYAAIANNFCRTCLLTHRYEDIRTTLASLQRISQQVSTQNQGLQAYIFNISALMEFALHEHTGTMQHTQTLVERVQEAMQQYKNNLRERDIYLLRYHIALSYFTRAHYREALEWFESLLQDMPKHLYTHLHLLTRLYLLPIHFELGNTTTLEHSIKTAQNYARKDGRLHPLIAPIAHSLLKALRCTTTNETHSVLIELYTTLQQPSKEQEQYSNIQANLFQWLRRYIQHKE